MAQVSVEQIEGEFGGEVEFSGGGRGQTATWTHPTTGGAYSAKGTSRAGALAALQAELRDQGGLLHDPDADEADFEGMTEGEAAQCVAECMTSQSDYCECKCGGVNHGALSGKSGVMRLGKKLCACGCGEETQRRFVPGHDARFHTAEAAKAAGLSVEAYRDSLRVARNERAAAGRRAKRAAIKAGAAKIAAALAAGTLAPKPVRRIRPTAQTPARGFVVQSLKVDGDLPF